MKVSEVCVSYFNGFGEIYNYNKNDYSINFLAMLKILSYFSVVIPLSFATVYGITLCGRVTPLSTGNYLHDVFAAYNPRFLPQANRKNLEDYSQSEDFKRHAKTARIYYNETELSPQDALKVIFQREPTNIAMGSNQYNRGQLAHLFGYEKSAYNDSSARKEDGTLFKELPNTATVYSETYLWYPPGGESKKEIACLSLPAPALDSSDQPHYEYYMSSGRLDGKKYEREIAFLFSCIEQAIMDNRESAFGNKGLKRVVLSKFGQGAFLGALTKEDQQIARAAYSVQLERFLSDVEEIEVVMSDGDILKMAREGDLIINAWDPHSAPGNGNDADHSFDGAMGKGSGIMLTQTAWFNEALRSQDFLVGITSGEN